MNNHTSNNFDFLRLLFSSLVIVSHSYPLTGRKEWFGEITNGQLSLGSLSVECFFIMSGYLIFTSLKNSKSIISYVWKRVLRIFPALVGLVLVTGVILSFITSNCMFMGTKKFMSYSLNLLSLYNVKYPIGDIFSTNPYPKVINGSLWSLSYEFTMYLLVGLLFWVRKSKVTIYILVLIYLATSFLYYNESSFLRNEFQILMLDVDQLYKLTSYFVAGSILSFVDFKKYNSLWLRSTLFCVLLGSLIIGVFKELSIFILPIFILLVATTSTPYLRSVAKKTGDLSYGIYIYGFLLQQVLMYYFNLSTWILTIIALPISLIFAYLSWHLIEKRMMNFKNLL